MFRLSKPLEKQRRVHRWCIALAMIRNREIGWEKFVPHKVETAIKEHGLFDYPYKIDWQEVPSGVAN